MPLVISLPAYHRYTQGRFSSIHPFRVPEWCNESRSLKVMNSVKPLVQSDYEQVLPTRSRMFSCFFKIPGNLAGHCSHPRTSTKRTSWPTHLILNDLIFKPRRNLELPTLPLPTLVTPNVVLAIARCLVRNECSSCIRKAKVSNVNVWPGRASKTST